MIDFLALKLGLETFEAGAVDAYDQAQEHKDVVVEPALEYLERLRLEGHGHCVAIATSTARKPCGKSELDGTHGWNSGAQAGFLSGARQHHSYTGVQREWTTFMVQRLPMDANNSSRMCHEKLNSKEVADASWENRMNISRDFEH